MSMGPSLEEERRRIRTARLVAVGSTAALVVIAVVGWIAVTLGREVVTSEEREQARAATPTPVTAAATGAPPPTLLARAILDPVNVRDGQTLRLQLPILERAVTGVGFMPRRDSAALPLDPPGSSANTSWVRRISQRFLATTAASDLRWFQLREGTPSMVTVGALPGAEVYAPLDARIQAIATNRIAGTNAGHVLQLQPVGDGQTIVVLRNLDVDPSLHVGMSVSQNVTRLGTVRDMEGLLDAPLARYTHDSGAGIDMYVLRSSEPQAYAGG